jgi:serine/threonine protein kinase/Tfp pilus assembly protein PilF
MIGKTISHYKIIEKLGQGGMGVVYLADDTKLKRQVAIKFLPEHLTKDKENVERFEREAEAAAALNHPNIVTIYDVLEEDDPTTAGKQLCIVMEYVDGISLREYVGATGSVAHTIENTITIITQIAEGLSKAHQAGIVHRDIKPENIIIDKDDRVKILDFGLAKLKGVSKLTKETSTLGTIHYMSPEQIQGKDVDERSDIWSLSVVMYELLTGKPPFTGDYEQAVSYAILNENIKQVIDKDLPEDLVKIIEKCLTKNPDDRYQNVDEIKGDLSFLKEESSVKPTRRSHLDKKRYFKIAIPVFVVVIAFITFIFVDKEADSTAPIHIAVVDFVDETGEDKWKSLSGLLTTSLEQSRRLSVITQSHMRDILKQFDKENIDYIDENLGREIANHANIKVLVIPTIRLFGQRYNIDIKVIDPIEDKYLFADKVDGEGEAMIFSMIDQLAENTREELEESEEEILLTAIPIEKITTSNYEAWQHYFNGQEYIDKYLFMEAEQEFEKAIELDSTFGLAYYRLTYAINFWEDDPQRAREPINKAYKYIDQIPDKEKYLVRFVKTSNDSGWGEAALNILREMEKIYPDDKEMMYNIGDISWHIGEFEEAIKYLDRVLEMDRMSIRALNHIKWSYQSKEDYTRALEYSQRIIDLTPNDPYQYYSRGEIFLRMNEYTKSIEMYKKALKIKPDLFYSHIGIVSNMIKMGKYQKARNHLNQWSEFASSDLEQEMIHHYLATTYIAEGNLENALKELENRGNLAEQSSDTLLLFENQFLISEILYENDRIIKAEEKLAAGKKLMESFDLSENIEITLWEQYLFSVTRFALKTGNMDQAKTYAEMYKKHVEKNMSPGYIIYYFTLSGLIAYAEENYEKSISELEQSNLDDPFNNYHLALAYKKNGDETKAIEKLESAVNYSGFVSLINEKVRVRAEKQLTILKADD